MSKSLKFLLFVAVFSWYMMVCFGLTVFMMMEGGWTCFWGIVLTIITLATLPHAPKFFAWVEKDFV